MGFKIDSSICTAARIHGGGFDPQAFPAPGSLLASLGVDIFEIPVPGVSLAGRDVQLFGGGYLRLAPRMLVNCIAARQDYQVLYVHPHDFDPDVPALPNRGRLYNLRRRIRIGDLRQKVRDLFRSSTVRSCGQLLPEAK